MSLVCFASFKGSPGTTLTALATAAAWPSGGNRRKLLLEADADGGVLALRYQMSSKPGLISLAAATRRGLSQDQLWNHAQMLPGGLPVVLGPEGPEQANEVLRGNGRDLGRWLSGLDDVDVIADVGRLSIGSAAFELATAADAVLGVVRPTAANLQPAAQRMAALSAYGLKVGWVLIGEKPYTVDDVRRAYGLPVVHVVERDERGAAQMETGANPTKLRRSPLVRSVAGLADSLHEWLHPKGALAANPPPGAAAPPPAAAAVAPSTAPPQPLNPPTPVTTPVTTHSASLVAPGPGTNGAIPPGPQAPPPPPPQHKKLNPDASNADRTAAAPPVASRNPDGLRGEQSGTPSLAILASQRGEEPGTPAVEDEAPS